MTNELDKIVQEEFIQLLNKKCKKDSYEQGTNKCPPNESTDIKKTEDKKSRVSITKNTNESIILRVKDPKSDKEATVKFSKHDGKYVPNFYNAEKSLQDFVNTHIDKINKIANSMKYKPLEHEVQHTELDGDAYIDIRKRIEREKTIPGTLAYWAEQQKKKQKK